MEHRPGLAIFFAVMLVASLVALAPSQPAKAQAEPTATPTPPYQYSVQLSSGATLVVERRITYGEIGVMLAVLILVLGNVVFWLIRIVRLYL